MAKHSFFICTIAVILCVNVAPLIATKKRINLSDILAAKVETLCVLLNDVEEKAITHHNPCIGAANMMFYCRLNEIYKKCIGKCKTPAADKLSSEAQRLYDKVLRSQHAPVAMTDEEIKMIRAVKNQECKIALHAWEDLTEEMYEENIAQEKLIALAFLSNNILNMYKHSAITHKNGETKPFTQHTEELPASPTMSMYLAGKACREICAMAKSKGTDPRIKEMIQRVY